MPTKEIRIPKILILLNLSLKAIKAEMGVNKGMVAMITELMVGDTRSSPKLSPMKYKKGLKKVESIRSLKCFISIFLTFPKIRMKIKRKMDDKTSLKKTVVIGS
jgi:hypothetical protein